MCQKLSSKRLTSNFTSTLLGNKTYIDHKRFCSKFALGKLRYYIFNIQEALKLSLYYKTTKI